MAPKAKVLLLSILPWAILLALYASWSVGRIQEQSSSTNIVAPESPPPRLTRRVARKVSNDDDSTELFADQKKSAASTAYLSFPAPAGASRGHCLDVGNYHRWFVNVLIDNFGRVIAEAVYDPDLFNDMVSTLKPRGDGTYHWDHDDEWVMHDMNQHPTYPAPFHSMSNMLWWGKRWTSVALSKVSRDAELQKLFERVCTDADHGVKLALFEKTVVQIINAQIQYFHTVLQLIIDITLNGDKRREFTNLVKDHQGMDTLVLVSGWIRAETKVSDLEAIFGAPSKLEEVVRGRLEAVKNEPVKNSQPNFPLRYDDHAYDQSVPQNGKLWTMLRPIAGCSTLTRMCENAEGCRLLCNPEYLLYAGRRGKKDATTGLSSPISSSAPTPYHHRVIGMGCNNEYDWELSFLNFFSGAAALSKGQSHRLGFTTCMDCTITIGPGQRQWRVPQQLKSAAIGYTGASLCVADKADGGAHFGPNTLKAFQMRAEATWTKPNAHDQPIVRFNAHPDALAAVQRRGDDTENKEFLMEVKTFQGKALPSPRWFDALTMLKIDVEGHEWKYIPAWIRGELISIRTNTPSGTFAAGSTAVIDFATAAPDFFTVSLFSLEFHRIGMHGNSGQTVASALRSHWFSLQTLALGYIMVAHEKNEFGHCCYENTYVHARHFVKSEMWMTLKDEL